MRDQVAIANIFERMAKVLAFKRADRFRILAYERASMNLRDWKEDLRQMAVEGRLREIPGIGKDLEGMIEEYLRTGSIGMYEKECRGIPEELIELMGIPGLGPRTLEPLHEKLGVSDLDSLRRALDTKAVLRLRGFGEKRLSRLQRSLQLWTESRQRLLLGVALPIAEQTIAEARKIAGVERAELAGSIRRRCETIGDIDLLVSSRNPGRVLAEIAGMKPVKEVRSLGDTLARVWLEEGMPMDVRAVAPEQFGSAWQYFTGSKAHNIHLRGIARSRGLKVNEYGVFGAGEKRLGGEEELEVYGLAGLPFIPPELREDRGEIETAERGELPRLIEISDLRGDLHVHTDFSDGRSSMEEMAETAERLGYEYIAFADHSPSQRVARGLEIDRLEEKIEALAALRAKRGGSGPRLLLGAEVDILADGRLDYPDDVLKRLDVVVAAVHSLFRQERARMTGRVLDALDNPYVHVLGHPMARLIGIRDPIDLDIEKAVRKAAERGVAIEMNGSYQRLDLNDTMARAAQEAGALLAIGSDAHSAGQLELIRYGVYQARRGWIEAPNVVNTWPWRRMRAWLTGRTARVREGALTGGG